MPNLMYYVNQFNHFAIISFSLNMLFLNSSGQSGMASLLWPNVQTLMRRTQSYKQEELESVYKHWFENIDWNFTLLGSSFQSRNKSDVG